jgi:predicted acyl esterase
MSSNDEAGVQAGQFWTTVEKFPTPTMTKFYFHGDMSVSTTVPSSAEVESTSYVTDPANPIQTKGGNNLWSDAPCGPLDQQEIDKRADVLVFQTPVLTEELPLTGPINGHLFVSSDAIDTDVMVSCLYYCV